MSVTAPLASAPRSVREKFFPPETRLAACLNCGTPLGGAYCSACGQRDIPPYPSVRELVVDAFWELSGWDGRFTSTARLLFRHPGALTREFLEGRRARYISPLRLYLMASVLYFLVAAGARTTDRVSRTTANGGGLHVGAMTTVPTAPATSRPERLAQSVEHAVERQPAVSSADRDSLPKEVARAPAVLRPLAQRALLDPAGFKRGIVDAMPRVLFALVPIFAVIVALVYCRRKYPEHLYFAIHLHAFVFLALTISGLARLTHFAPLVAAAGLTSVVWIPIYATIAFRRTYGGSMIATLAKEPRLDFST